MTAPALPGAAPDPDRLPPEVEKAQAAFLKSAKDASERFIKWNNPDDDGEWDDAAHDAMTAAFARQHADYRALIDAMRAATAGSGAASPAAGASARALGGDGEPVAWGVRDRTGRFVITGERQSYCDAVKATYDDEIPSGRPFTVVPLYTRPAATGDTGDGGARG